MELHQKHQITHRSPLQSTKFKPGSKQPANPSGGGVANKFVGVRQRRSGRWVAEIKDTTQKIRMWLGTFETAEAAALAYDEAACLLRGSNTRTNFSTRRPSGDSTAPESPVATRIRKLLHHKKQAKEGDGEGSASPKHHKNASFLHSADIAAASGSSGTSPTRNRKQEMCNPWLPEEPFEAAFNGFELGEHGSGLQEMCSGGAAEEVGVLERMKVERQISASLYAMNGVQDYFDAMQEWSASSPLLDSAWDFHHFYMN